MTADQIEPRTSEFQRGSSLEGRVALVTGGGRGIGRAHALRLARDGAAVLVNDLGCGIDGRGVDVSVADAVVSEIQEVRGIAVADTSSVASLEGGQALVDRALETFGRIDILVNNAGISGPMSEDEDFETHLDRQLAVHLKATLGTMQAAIPHMRAAQWGRIVNTVSEVALDMRMGGAGVYGIAKAAVWSATLSTATQLLGTGITVNALAPNARTRMNDILFKDQEPSRDIDASHVADVMAYLVSEQAADITGRVVFVAGTVIREYVVRRVAETDAVERISNVLQQLQP